VALAAAHLDQALALQVAADDLRHVVEVRLERGAQGQLVLVVLVVLVVLHQLQAERAVENQADLQRLHQHHLAAGTATRRFAAVEHAVLEHRTARLGRFLSGRSWG
jgi:ABC-type Fe2+-enterobactin transport system substrate-binding protein